VAAMNNPPRLIDAAGITVELRRGGSGTPLLVIHGELGVPGWLESFAHLAEHYDVIVPSLPGYGRSTRPDWVMGVHDLATWVTWFARDVNLRPPVNVIGCSLGGWVAAEIATVAPQFFNKMVLVGAVGIKPEQGEIFDYFLESGLTGLRRLPSARAILGVHALLGDGVDAGGGRSCRAASRDDLPDRLEALHAQPHAAPSPAQCPHADIAGVGTRGRDHADR
jgi:pimeloyl-ACP methyl ester carboxylesterase